MRRRRDGLSSCDDDRPCHDDVLYVNDTITVQSYILQESMPSPTHTLHSSAHTYSGFQKAGYSRLRFKRHSPFAFRVHQMNARCKLCEYEFISESLYQTLMITGHINLK